MSNYPEDRILKILYFAGIIFFFILFFDYNGDGIIFDWVHSIFGMLGTTVLWTFLIITGLLLLLSSFTNSNGNGGGFFGGDGGDG